MPKYSKKQKIEIAQAVCALYSSGEYTLDSCCKSVGITSRTFQNWSGPLHIEPEEWDASRLKEINKRGYLSQVRELYKKAKADNEVNFKLVLRNAAREGLLKKARGFSYEETTKERNEDGELKVTKKVTKLVVPSDTALIFVAKNTDPDNFKDRVENVHSGEINVNKKLNELTDAELDALLDKYEKINKAG